MSELPRETATQWKPTVSDETVPRAPDPLAAHRGPLPEGTPSHLGRYGLLRLLGGGTFGRVYLAFDPEIERYVAVKLPLLPPDSHREFLREARVVAQLQHPNICPVYDVGVHNGLPFIVMRFVKDTLDGLLARGLPTTTDALKFTGKIAKGLVAAHAKGVIHRDLKPANILYDEERRELLLTDFGVARRLESGTVTTGGIKGSPAFMAPEQWGPGGQFGEISACTDVYSLGVVLFRLLTGEMLFAGTPHEQMFHHCFTTPRRPSEVNPLLDVRLDDLCLNALAKQPSERYASAKEFVDTIANYLRLVAKPERVRQENKTAEQAQQAEEAVRRNTEEESWAKDPLHSGHVRKAGEQITIRLPGNVPIAFAWCPPGSFQMGSNHPKIDDWGENEIPVHKVTLSKGFFMGVYPVTQSQWQAVMGTDPSYFKGVNRPVESVLWKQCREFCTKLTDILEGRVTVRVPTEAEWEYACRAGTSTEYHFGDVINTNLANYNGALTWNDAPRGENRRTTTDVDSFPPNPCGLYDMHGNVEERCSDRYSTYQANDQIDPHGQSEIPGRVARGGSWNSIGDRCRAASRGLDSSTKRFRDFGIRVCFCLDREGN